MLKKDAADLDQLLSRIGFETTLLSGKYISPDAVLGEIKKISRSSKENDTLIFFFSGHGAPGATEEERGRIDTLFRTRK